MCETVLLHVVKPSLIDTSKRWLLETLKPVEQYVCRAVQDCGTQTDSPSSLRVLNVAQYGRRRILLDGPEDAY